MKVLVNAYACSPNMGSEPGMAWNWCSNLAKYCELFIITEGEFRNRIESELPLLPQGHNMHFYYNPVSDKIRKMCWNQGDWRFYRYYHQWQKKTLDIARKICEEENIDIIHQLNMIGFREPGLLWKVDGPKFVWGPIGGLENVPISYLKGTTPKTYLFNAVKNTVTELQLRYQKSVREAVKHADAIVASSKGCQVKIESYYHKTVYQINENGCDLLDIDYKPAQNKEQFDLVWCGKFDFRKRLDLAMKTIAELKDLKIKLHILGLGDGSRYEELAKELQIENHVEWHWGGHEIVNPWMRRADALFFTSVSDATSRTVMEAIQNLTPVICFDICGFGTVVDESIGVKIPISNPVQSVKDFAAVIRSLYNDREKVARLSANCKERIKLFTWDSEVKQMFDIYQSILI